MKFSEMPYSRPDMEALAAATTQTLEAMKAAPNAAGQIAAYDAYEKKMQTAGTMQQIATSVIPSIPRMSSTMPKMITWMRSAPSCRS